MGGLKDIVYRPIPENVAVYDKMYADYKKLYDYFGWRDDVMKRLRALRPRSLGEQRLGGSPARRLHGLAGKTVQPACKMSARCEDNNIRGEDRSPGPSAWHAGRIAPEDVAKLHHRYTHVYGQ